MKVSREQAAQNRERIIEAAAQLFRERGFEGIGVADLMKEAGLTHGGFYGHFSSKDDLIAEASARALTRSLSLFSNLPDRASRDSLPAIARAYLTREHRDDPGTGCLLAAVGSDMSRQGPAARHAVSDHIRSAVELLTKLIPGKSRAARRQKAISTYATLVGAMVMARAVADRELSQEILDAGRASVKG
jgi:TetR/AcrR family transcriptional repressor of nem operon